MNSGVMPPSVLLTSTPVVSAPAPIPRCRHKRHCTAAFCHHPQPRAQIYPRSPGLRSRTTTEAPRGACPLLHPCTYARPTGTRSHALTEAPRGARHSPPPRTSSRSTDRRSRAPTAAPSGARHWLPSSTSPRPKGRRFGATTAAPQGARHPPRACTSLCQTAYDRADADSSSCLSFRAPRLVQAKAR